MIKTIALAVICINFISTLLAHTCMPDTAVCPIDSQKVGFCVTMSMTTFGSYYDFQKKGAIGTLYEESVNSCPKCHYSGYISDFKRKLSSTQKDSIVVLLGRYRDTEMTDPVEFKVAAEIHTLLGEKYSKVGHLYLVGSYLLRPSRDTAERKKYQHLTCEYLIKALDSSEYKKEEQATILYLIGELYRRQGAFDKAGEYFRQALLYKPQEDWLKNMITDQQKLVDEKNENNNI